MTDLYNFKKGVEFAREFITSAPGNLTATPIIASLKRCMGNKPPAQQEGIKSVIYLLETAEDIQAARAKA
jgi:hypothetical protein